MQLFEDVGEDIDIKKLVLENQLKDDKSLKNTHRIKRKTTLIED